MNEQRHDTTKSKLLVINYLQCQNSFRTKERFLKTPYFLYVHKGKGIYIIDENQYICKEGDLFFCPCGVPNTIIADDKDPYSLSGIEFEFFEVIPEFSFPPQFKEHINIRDNPQFLWLIHELINRYASNDDSYAAYTQTLFNTWLLLVANLGISNPRTSIVEKIAAYPLANDYRDVSMAEISKKFKYHPNHINRMFKCKFGTSICQYHLELRLKKAKQLMVYSNHSISEISSICGFEDLNYFSRIFKKKLCYTPSQYRETYGLNGCIL